MRPPGRAGAAALLLALLAPGLEASISARARARIMAEEGQRARSRYGLERAVVAEGEGIRVRYRGLFPVRGLALRPDPSGTPTWAVYTLVLEADGRPLTAPGILEIDLSTFSFPAGTFREPMQVLEAYQLQRDGRWTQMPAIERDPDRPGLHVHRDTWGTGRIALAYRLHQPPALLELERSPRPDAPEVVFLHGVDGARSDYSGPFDVLDMASCVGRQVYFFQYPSGRPIPSNALAFRRALGRRREAGELPPGRRRILVAYSMGGLVARYALQRLDLPVEFTDLVLLAVPNRGSRALSVMRWHPFLSRRTRRVLDLWPGLEDLIRGSRFLRRPRGSRT